MDLKDFDLEKLTEEERKLFVSVFQNMDKGKKPLQNTLTEYYLEYKLICNLCGTEGVSYFKMQKSKKASQCLESVPVTAPEEGAKLKREQSLTGTCPFCEKVLQGWEKEKLIKLLIERS